MLCTKAIAQRGHIDLALLAFLIIDKWCFLTGANWLTAKWKITTTLSAPFVPNPVTASAQLLLRTS